MSLLTSRRLIIVAVTFAVFIVFDIVLFGWLIFKSLSQREVEQALLETRNEAEPLARELEERARSLGQDLYVTVSVTQETHYIQSFLTQRETIRRFEIRDRKGTVVYQEKQELPLREPEGPRTKNGGDDKALNVVPEVGRWQTARPPGELQLEEVEVPIGDLGTMVIGLSRQALLERIGVLRQDLIRQTSLIGVLTLSLLLMAFAAIWTLFRRARRLEEQAAEAERLAYVGTLASGLAHEIRNPLNSLSLNMQMLEEETSHAGGAQKRLLAITRSELQRLERLATDFLSYAKPRPLELEELPAVELLEQVLEVMGGEIQERGAVVEIEDSSAGAQVRVDRGQIKQLLINLTQNALAAAEGAGSAVVRLIARRTGGEVALEVADTGPGIPIEDQERIFDIFFSTRKGGTGLGLAIVKHVAHAHRGEIQVVSQPGAGSCFTLVLPLTRAEKSV
jgi:signal transduction histidine kinase